jgi:hypothetical protein
MDLLVELDRDTMRSAAMARSLQLYRDYANARFREGERGTTAPYWRTVYCTGHRFPPLLVVVADVDQDGLIRRAKLLHRVAAALEPATYTGTHLRIAVTSLDKLQDRGPWDTVWVRVG